jgi:hypothetical protein
MALTRATRRRIPEGSILRSHCRENLQFYNEIHISNTQGREMKVCIKIRLKQGMLDSDFFGRFWL